jgi:Holliday junction resolvasome RuvABC endonuclease subunit
MIILGADLSFARTGLVWIDNQYTVWGYRALTFKPGPHRYLRILKAFKEAVPEAGLCIIEDYAYGAPSRTVIVKLAELGGVFKSVLEAKNVDYLQVSPSAIKKFITGKGTAEKHIVAQELSKRYCIAFPQDPGFDLSDAAAAAVWGVNHAG